MLPQMKRDLWVLSYWEKKKKLEHGMEKSKAIRIVYADDVIMLTVMLFSNLEKVDGVELIAETYLKTGLGCEGLCFFFVFFFKTKKC